MPAMEPAATSSSQPVYTPMGPTRPHVPMPDEMAAPSMRRPNTQVAMGPVMAEVRMAGIQMRGLRTMLPICSIEVPRPCDTRPPQPFSLKLITAKPTIWAQHPATAAPPAKPVRPSAAQMAAEEMGNVRKMPTATDTTMPMAKGCRSHAHITTPPSHEAAAPMPGAQSMESPHPTTITTKGVTRMSIFVSPATSLPASQATMATTSTARGPPAPPSVLAAAPTATSENSTSAGARRAKPIETAMAGPAAAFA